MAITPRADEVAAVKELLLDDSYTDPEMLAKAIVARVSAVLAMRSSHLLVVGRQTAYGPFWAERDATKAARALEDQGTVTRLQASPGALLANIDVEGLDPEVKKDSGYCNCRHPNWMHLMDGNSRGKCGFTYSEQCNCPKFVELGKTTRAAKKAPNKKSEGVS